MSIVSSELKLYGAANMVEADTGTVGGAIDVAVMVEQTEMAANDRVSVQSDGADTRTITVTGRLATGVIDSEAIVLNGVTWVDGAKTFERVLKIVAGASSGTRTVSVARYNSGTHTPAITTVPINVTSVRRMFYDAASEVGATVRYEKLFYKNTNGTTTLNAAKVQLSSDPSTFLAIALEDAVDDNGTSANRKTLPTGIGTFQTVGVDISVPGGVLAAGSVIGVWLRLSLAGGASAFKNSFALQLSGTTV